jgi:hypothetical protein
MTARRNAGNLTKNGKMLVRDNVHRPGSLQGQTKERRRDAVDQGMIDALVCPLFSRLNAASAWASTTLATDSLRHRPWLCAENDV